MNQHRTFLIVGNSFSPLTAYLREHGHEYIVLKDTRLARDPSKQLKRRVLCDFSSWEATDTAVDKVASEHHIDGVLVVYEHYVLTAAKIAARLGLPGLPIDAARACTDKGLMREKFALAPEPVSPAFAEVETATDLEAFAAAHSFPLILKPANLSKSLLVFKNANFEELMANYERMTTTINAVYEKYASGVAPKILVEEFMEGPVHAVDAFVDHNGTPHVLEQVVDYETGYDIGYDDNFHYSRLLPSALGPSEIAAIRHTAEVGCRALGMKSSPAHVEIIRTKNGPRIVEIGARNGGYRSRMHWLANGLDITGNALHIALGEQPDLAATKNESVGVFELFPKQPGTFAGIENEDALRALPSFISLAIQAQPGDYIGKSSDGYKMTAIVILHHADKAQFTTDLAYLNQHVRVLTSH